MCLSLGGLLVVKLMFKVWYFVYRLCWFFINTGMILFLELLWEINMWEKDFLYFWSIVGFYYFCEI